MQEGHTLRRPALAARDPQERYGAAAAAPLRHTLSASLSRLPGSASCSIPPLSRTLPLTHQRRTIGSRTLLNSSPRRLPLWCSHERFSLRRAARKVQYVLTCAYASGCGTIWYVGIRAVGLCLCSLSSEYGLTSHRARSLHLPAYAHMSSRPPPAFQVSSSLACSMRNVLPSSSSCGLHYTAYCTDTRTRTGRHRSCSASFASNCENPHATIYVGVDAGPRGCAGGAATPARSRGGGSCSARRIPCASSVASARPSPLYSLLPVLLPLPGVLPPPRSLTSQHVCYLHARESAARVVSRSATGPPVLIGS